MESITKIQSVLHEGVLLSKCRKCRCMNETLMELKSSLSSLRAEGSSDLLKSIEGLLQQMGPAEHECLGCEYCYPAEAMNLFNQSFPEAAQGQSVSCAFEVKDRVWPPVPGEYFVLCGDQSCSFAVSTLSSPGLAETISGLKPRGLCIVGKTETENIGIDKVIKNIVTNHRFASSFWPERILKAIRAEEPSLPYGRMAQMMR